jgi:hypothetical protein
MDHAAPPASDTDAPELEIASLSRSHTSAAGDVARVAGAAAPLLNICIYRQCPAIPKTGDFFKLKMLLVRKLRRGFRSAVIQVDDAAGTDPADAPFEITLEPNDPAGIERATKVIQRVLRSRHWRAGHGAR